MLPGQHQIFSRSIHHHVLISSISSTSFLLPGNCYREDVGSFTTRTQVIVLSIKSALFVDVGLDRETTHASSAPRSSSMAKETLQRTLVRFFPCNWHWAREVCNLHSSLEIKFVRMWVQTYFIYLAQNLQEQTWCSPHYFSLYDTRILS
jgi:hypothetical protein